MQVVKDIIYRVTSKSIGSGDEGRRLEELGLDSLDVIEVVMELEEDLNIKLGYTHAKQVASFVDLCEEVEKSLGLKSNK